MSNKNNSDLVAFISAMLATTAVRDLKEEKSFKDDAGESTEPACDCPACLTEHESLQSSDNVPAGRVLVINRLMRSVERLRSLKQIDSETDNRLLWLMTGIVDPKLSAETFSSIVNDIGTLLDAEFNTLKPGTPDPIDRKDVINGLRSSVEFVLSRPNLTETNRIAINALMSAVKDPGTSAETLSECVTALHRIIIQVKRYS